MSAPVPHAQNPPIAASQTAAPVATSPATGSSVNVAAGSAQPTARSSYASATKKISSPPIASSAAPPVAVGGPQNAQHGKSSSISPMNGKPPILPAVPTMTPTIVNGTPSQGDHSRKSSITISAAGTSGNLPNGGPVASSRAPSNLTFGSIAGSPAPAHVAPHRPQPANLNPQAANPRVASPAHSPSPIPSTANISGGKPETLPTRPGLVFGGGSDNAEPNARPISMPPQPNSHPQAQHLRRESSQSAHSDMSNANMNMNRGFPPNGGRGRGYNPNFNPQMGHNSPQPYRPLPNQPRGGPNMAPPFQPQVPIHPNSPYRANRSPHISAATVHQQQQYANPAAMPYGYQQQYPPQHQPMYGVPPQQGLDPYNPYYGTSYGLQQSMHAYPGPIPNSPRNGHNFPQPMQTPYGMPGPYGQPQAQSMSRTPSNISERPSSAVAQPSTPAMTNVSHVTHSHPSSVTTGSPAPGSAFSIPAKKPSKAIVIKTADGEVVDFSKKKGTSPAPPSQPTHQPPRSPAIVSTPTPPPRAPSATESSHSRVESLAMKSDVEKKADFKSLILSSLKAEEEKGEAEKKAILEQEAKAKAEAEAQALKEKEEAEAKAAQEKAAEEKAIKEREEAAAAEKAKEEEAEKARLAAEKKRLDDEEMERMIAEMEAAEREEEERQKKYEEKKQLEREAAKANEAQRIKLEEEKLRQQEREAEEIEEARAKETPEQKAEREALFAGLKKQTQFGPAATLGGSESGASTPTAPTVPTITQPPQPKTTGSTKPKPTALKLDTHKPVEPAQPTAGMQSLKSARFLQVRSEMVQYPPGISSPNPALNQGSKSKGRVYDKDFLLQFQKIFSEKPSVDWDMKLKETVGDSTDSARPQSARPSAGGMGGRQSSRPGLGVSGHSGMGTFGQGQGLGRGIPAASMTSQQRFEASTSGRAPMTNPLAHMVSGGTRGTFPMGPPSAMSRQTSYQNVSQADRGPNSPRNGSSRGRGAGGSRRGNGPRENPNDAKAMPLTQGADIRALERSTTGWKPHGSEKTPAPGAAHLSPEVVQRKVKGALNKMTPEKFDRISDQILEIAAQSKDETDGRTLRQVIQLTFEKACDEAHWASMYAKFCNRMLQTMSTDIKDENVRDKHGSPVVGGALFRKYLLNRCQEEFERGWEVNLPDKPEGETAEAVILSDEYYIAAAAKRKGLGLIQFIGELYKLGMLTLRIMHECVLKLLDFEGLPDESAIESLVKLLRTVGSTMEATDTGPKMIAVYFERIEKIMKMDGLPSRLQFMLLDTVDLRRAGWKSKDDAKGPKTIAEIRQEAAVAQQAAEAERARSNQRGGGGGGRIQGGRGDARSFSNNNFPPPQDYPTGRVQMDDLRKLSKGASGRNMNNASLGPSMLGSRSSSGRRGLGPGGSLLGRGDDSGNSSRTTTPPVQKEKESATHANSFSALMDMESEGAGEVGSPPPSTTSSPPTSKSNLARSKSPAVDVKDTKSSE